MPAQMTQQNKPLPPINREEAGFLAEMITYGLGQIAYHAGCADRPEKGMAAGQIATTYLQKTLDRNLLEEADPEAGSPNIDDGQAMVRNLEVLLASQRAMKLLNAYADSARINGPDEYDLRDLAESAIISALLMSGQSPA